MPQVSMNLLALRLTIPPPDSGVRRLKVYVAGKFEAKDRLRQWAMDMQRKLGWEIVSTWLWDPLTRQECAERGCEYDHARADLTEIRHCDALILDTEDESVTGGREFEAGYAHALGKIVLLTGPQRNIFHTLLPSIGDYGQIS